MPNEGSGKNEKGESERGNNCINTESNTIKSYISGVKLWGEASM